MSDCDYEDMRQAWNAHNDRQAQIDRLRERLSQVKIPAPQREERVAKPFKLKLIEFSVDALLIGMLGWNIWQGNPGYATFWALIIFILWLSSGFGIVIEQEKRAAAAKELQKSSGEAAPMTRHLPLIAQLKILFYLGIMHVTLRFLQASLWVSPVRLNPVDRWRFQLRAQSADHAAAKLRAVMPWASQMCARHASELREMAS